MGHNMPRYPVYGQPFLPRTALHRGAQLVTTTK
jgi:hypothetical protein